mgnify:CR=1 FL=1
MSLLVIDLKSEMSALGNVVLGGDFATIRYVVFKQVDRYIDDFESYAQALADGLGLLGRAAFFFTAVDVFTVRYVAGKLADIYATIGLSNPACIGGGNNGVSHTVNILVISKKPLSRRGLIDLYRTAAEAKAAVLTARGLCGGRPALGTTSDAILVAARPGVDNYAGFATELGLEVSFLIYNLFNKN